MAIRVGSFVCGLFAATVFITSTKGFAAGYGDQQIKTSKYERLPHLFKNDIERRKRQIEVEITGLRDHLHVGHADLLDHWASMFDNLIRSSVARNNHFDRNFFAQILGLNTRQVLARMHDGAFSIEYHLLQFQVEDGRVYHYLEGGGFSGHVRGTFTMFGPKRIFSRRRPVLLTQPFIATAVFPGAKSPWGTSEEAHIRFGEEDVRSEVRSRQHNEASFGDGETLLCARQLIKLGAL